MYLQVYRPSGRIQGMLALTVKLGHVYQYSPMPAPFARMAQTVEPNNITNYPAHSPNGYNQAGGDQYPQYPPQHPPPYPQSYPPVLWPPPPYIPPPGPYPTPHPSRRTGLFGIHGFTDLLASIFLGVRLFDDVAGIGFGAGGFGGGGVGGGGFDGFGGGGFGGSGFGGGGYGA